MRSVAYSLSSIPHPYRKNIMALAIGIVGLPNVGKSTTFNALTKEQNAEAANYPFCTIEPNKAIVAVPDSRIDKLTELVSPEKTIYSTIEFVDIAGLVAGASQGEGMGNKFLGNIRETNAIVHVVRCFDDENVVHVDERGPDPVQDIEIINTELLLADVEQLERKIERLVRTARTDKSLRPMLALAEALQAHCNEGNSVASFPDRDSELFKELRHEMRFLTGKTVIYAANVSEERPAMLLQPTTPTPYPSRSSIDDQCKQPASSYNLPRFSSAEVACFL